jgi:hypothetical protein
MGGGRQWPTANRGSPEWKKETAVVFGARGARGKGNGGEWEGLEPKKLIATKKE